LRGGGGGGLDVVVCIAFAFGVDDDNGLLNVDRVARFVGVSNVVGEQVVVAVVVAVAVAVVVVVVLGGIDRARDRVALAPLSVVLNVGCWTSIMSCAISLCTTVLVDRVVVVDVVVTALLAVDGDWWWLLLLSSSLSCSMRYASCASSSRYCALSAASLRANAIRTLVLASIFVVSLYGDGGGDDNQYDELEVLSVNERDRELMYVMGALVRIGDNRRCAADEVPLRVRWSSDGGDAGTTIEDEDLARRVGREYMVAIAIAMRMM
jgi:hypothetical protein